MSDTAKWYVVQTYSGYENKVAQNIEKVVTNQNLQDLIQEVKIPTEIVVETKDGKQREVERKIFPSYVLVKMLLTDESWYIVRNTRGVTGFVGNTTTPIPLRKEEVDALGVESKKVEIDFAVGDSVKVIEGPLDGFTGIVNGIDLDNNKVKVTVSMFGRETPVELEITQIQTAR